MGLNIGWDRSADDGQGDNDVNEYSVRYSTSNDPPLSGDEITTITADGSASYSYGYGAHANGTEAFVAIVAVDDAGNTSTALTGSINEVSSATGSDDFSAYTAGGGLPSAWSTLYSTPGWDIEDNAGVGGSGKALKATFDGTDAFAYPDAIGTEDDIEILVRVQADDLGGDDIEALEAGIRVGGSLGSEDIYRFRLTTNSSAEHFYNISKYVGGSFTSIQNSPQLTDSAITNASWYYIRAQAIGTNLKIRVWEEGTTEPGTWSVEVTDNSLSNGFAGLYTNKASTFYCDYIGWSTNPSSESAPLPA